MSKYYLWFQIKVMHKQLVLLHNAVSAYFSGNAVALESTLKQFNIKVNAQFFTYMKDRL